jgi:drug/metabolite transporter (DMT)-like permease
LKETTLAEPSVEPATTGGRGKFLRTCLALLFFIALKAAGNLSLAWGMKHTEAVSTNPMLYLKAMLDLFVAGGVVMLILALLTRMVLFSLADLSFILPVTAVGYVLAAFLGKFFLHETVTAQRWLGTALICAGAALVGSTSLSTTSLSTKPQGAASHGATTHGTAEEPR